MNSTIFIILGLIVLSLGFTILIGVLVKNKRQKKAYAIEPGGKKRLEITTKGSWKETKIWFDGILVCTISNKRELLTSREFQLPDKSILRIKLAKISFSFYEIQLWRNEEPLHDLEPLIGLLFKIASGNVAIAIAGGIYIIFSFVLLVLSIISPQHFGIRLDYLLNIFIVGLVYLVLSFFAQRKSMIVLILATTILVLDGIVGVLVYVSLGNSAPLGLWLLFAISPIIISRSIIGIFLLILMIRGIAALIALEKKEDYPGARGAKTLTIIIAISGIAASFLWAMINPASFSTIKTFNSQIASPFAKISQTPLESTLMPLGQQNQAGGICWTYELQNFDGNRSQAWDKILDDKTKTLLPLNQFIVDVVQHNPQLIKDGYVFYGQKTYTLPELCP
jgi:hypothetical protein